MSDPMTTTQAPEGVRERLRRMVEDQHLLPGNVLRDAFDALSVPVNGQGSEPVAWFRESKATPGDWYQIRPFEADDLRRLGMRVEALYAAQQAPISDDTQAGEPGLGALRERVVELIREHVQVGDIGSCSIEIIGQEEAADAILSTLLSKQGKP